jgi:hypothetical protein
MEETKQIREQYCDETKLETCYPSDNEIQASWVCLPTWEYVEWLEKKLESVATTNDVPSPSRQVETRVRQLPSDEEIEKEARVRGIATITDLDDDNSGTVELEEGFIQGARWMRNQARQSA